MTGAATELNQRGCIPAEACTDARDISTASEIKKRCASDVGSVVCHPSYVGRASFFPSKRAPSLHLRYDTY